MKELNLLNIITQKLDDNSYLGNDCAYIDDLGIIVTQDTLVEDVHFSLYTTSPYLLGRKSISVNLSDLAAALATPKYVTVSISLPNTIKDDFIENLYEGINDICRENNIKVVGGDITGSEKVIISVCAIGKKEIKYISERNKAKKDDLVVVTGFFGSSSTGLYSLQNFLLCAETLKEKHLNPIARIKEANILRDIITSDIAIMDASDGLADSLYKIANASKHSIEIDYNKIPIDKEVKDFVKRNNLDIDNFVLWGGEDFELVMCISEETYEKLDESLFKCIGRVINKDNNPNVILRNENNSIIINKETFEKKSYNHFGDCKND